MVQLQKGEQNNFVSIIKPSDYIISNSSVMKAIKSQINQASRSLSPVLILGEEGTGKKMIAECIFKLKNEKDNAFYHINCYSLGSDFISSEIFVNKDELFSKTKLCTLYIQGIEQLSLEAQSFLLRVAQDFAYKTQLIASSREDLPAKVNNGSFLPELFHYLSKNMIIVPSLKERAEDISSLVRYFLEQGRYKKSISKKALRLLESYNWKRNVAELKKICERLNALSEDKSIITVDHLTDYMKGIEDLSFFVKYNPEITLDELTNYYIREALKHYKSKKKVAKSLGISVKTIYNRIEKGLIA